MKWFIPAMPLSGSRRHTETQEPSTVTITRSSPLAKYSPGNSFTASQAKYGS